jgi:enamine deaminase RidA (YjgF/YER057c/UK114 family)
MVTKNTKERAILVAARVEGSDIEHAACVRAGPWLFLTGIEATDYTSGLAAGVQARARLPYHGRPKHRREADFIVGRFAQMLELAGSSLTHAARVDQYYTTWKAVDSYHHARKAAFGSHIPPSTSIVVQELLGSEFEISVSLIAVRAGCGLDPQRVEAPKVGAPAWSGFAPAVTCGDLVFVAGQMARGLDGGYDARAHVSPHSLWGGYEIRKQTEHIITESLAPALEAAGSSFANAVKAQAYVRHIDDVPHLLDVWDSYFGERKVALTIVPAVEFGHVSANLEINLIAVRNGGSIRKEIVQADVPEECCFGAPGVRAGDLLFLSGMHAADGEGPVAGLRTASSFPHLGIASRAQMSFVLDQADKLCAAAGTSLTNVVRAQHFLTDLSQFPGMHRVWRERLGSGALPFSAVRVPTPQAVPDCSLSLDLWFFCPKGL